MQEFDAEETWRDLERRMSNTVATLEQSMAGLRSGKAMPSLLEPIRVEAYGDMMPISQLATVNAPEPSLLVVNVWDETVTKNVAKAILNADLGLVPNAEGQVIRVPIPAITGERRKELAKKAREYKEGALVALRNVRRDAMEGIKKAEHDKLISEDQARTYSDKVESLTKRFSETIGTLVDKKINEITVA